MKKILAILCLCALAGCATGGNTPVPPPSATTRVAVWMFDGLGGQITSPGVAQIGSQLSAIPGVQVRGEYQYNGGEASVIADAKALPASITKVVFGYSCGVWSTSDVAASISPMPVYLVAIQASLYCAPPRWAITCCWPRKTYNNDCLTTGGLGCAVYSGASGYPLGRITLIVRPDSHGEADINPDAQNDVVKFVRSLLPSVSARLRAASPVNKKPHKCCRQAQRTVI